MSITTTSTASTARSDKLRRGDRCQPRPGLTRRAMFSNEIDSATLLHEYAQTA
jgi:hypothetical protein